MSTMEQFLLRNVTRYQSLISQSNSKAIAKRDATTSPNIVVAVGICPILDHEREAARWTRAVKGLSALIARLPSYYLARHKLTPGGIVRTPE
ncbi:hypothetical protein BDV24DRAFT_161027 [Aspergillus arachidicola]|uniref:Uncharacterized protein n=1 Tax=Aspergillus arachidicola TaxID=656916 RepID=A0A5N6YET6_9EURO|nr:hypothetical protein BDV24DRAFT_161027 [Aspergillus arachidicola]